MKQAITLILDSSTPTLFLGLVRGTTILGYHVETLDRQQSEWMMPRLLTLLQQFHLTMKNIDAIVVGHGPGSYTGVRLALTFVKTLGFVHTLDIYPVSSLALIAIEPLSLSWLDARGGRMYMSVVKGHHILQEAMILPQSERSSFDILHPGGVWITPADAWQSPLKVIQQALTLKANMTPLRDIQSLTPLYLKELQ